MVNASFCSKGTDTNSAIASRSIPAISASPPRSVRYAPHRNAMYAAIRRSASALSWSMRACPAPGAPAVSASSRRASTATWFPYSRSVLANSSASLWMRNAASVTRSPSISCITAQCIPSASPVLVVMIESSLSDA